MKGLLVIVLVLAAVVAFGFWAFLQMWPMVSGAPMTAHGYVAMGLGLGLTALLAGGLMWLAFFSSRKGFDDIDRDEEL